MKHVICSVRDAKAEVFGRPFFTPTLGSAIRSFLDEANREHPDNAMYHHPEDFTLYHIGEFEDSTAEFTPVMPKVISAANEAAHLKEVGYAQK